MIFSPLHSEILLDALAFALPLGGIALSAWSFRFAEVGATPDEFPDSSGFLDAEDEMLRGQRFRARESARATFTSGAVLLAAAVPMGSANAHVHDAINLSALAGCALLALCGTYGVSRIVRIWRLRRDDAFSIYFSKDMFFLNDREKTRALYMALNPMPLWTLPDRNWFSKRILPSIDVVYRKASKMPAEQTAIAPSPAGRRSGLSRVRPQALASRSELEGR
jgi:hypothetical protein